LEGGVTLTPALSLWEREGGRLLGCWRGEFASPLSLWERVRVRESFV
jgi:hypothetical protein